MKISSLDTATIRSAPAQLARLSGAHGYRFDGDTAHLNAMFALLDPAAHEQSWALQLWACPSAPYSARDLAGHVVAEVALPPMGEIADETEHFEVSAFALPPAGTGEHVMVLALASGRSGQFNQVHDFAVYPRREEFTQPQMSGNVGYRINGSRVQILVDRVENPRLEGSRSGTLSLELWALPVPFTGGAFKGHHLAGVEIGSLDGEYFLAMQPIDLAFTAPPAGTWNIVLMLREWTAAGFATRDFTSFEFPYVVAPVAPIVEKNPAKEIAKTITPASPATSTAPAKALASIVSKVPAVIVGKASARGVAKAPVAVVAKVPAAVVARGVSVNTARVEELAAVKGLNAKLAEGIVKKRPFSSLDELGNVKGLGGKTLAKIRSSLRL